MRKVAILTLSLFFLCTFSLMHAKIYVTWDMLQDDNTYNDPYFDSILAREIVSLLKHEEVNSVADLGCGSCDYVRKLINMGFQAVGYDENPDSAAQSEGIAFPLIVTEPFDLGQQFEWIISLEAGRFLTEEHEQTFIENLTKHSTQGIVISNCINGTDSTKSHFLHNSHFTKLFEHNGFTRDYTTEYRFKQTPLQYTVMVFRKGGH